MPLLSRIRANERTRLRGSMGLPVGSEHQADVSPGGAKLYPVGFLLLPTGGQCMTSKTE